MDKIFVNFLPPWVETNIQPAFYDKESGSVLQQTARMYAKVQCLVRMFNKLSKETKETVEEYIAKFVELKDFVDTFFENLDVQEEINNKLDQMVEEGTFDTLLANYLVICGGNAKELGCAGDGVTDDTSALQNAITQMHTLGINKLVIPNGSFVISDEISLPSNFELVGMEGSVLKYVGAGTEGNIINIEGTDADHPIENVNITNITINGNGQIFKGGHTESTPAVTDTDPYARGLLIIRTNFAKNVKIRDCTFEDIYGDGIGIYYSTDVKILNNSLYDVSSGNLSNGTEQGAGQTGYDNHGDGIVAFFSYNVIFDGNTIINTRKYLTGMPSAIGKLCGRSGLEFEYAVNQNTTSSQPDNPLLNAPDYLTLPLHTIDGKPTRYGVGLVMSNNYVYGYTKGIHLENRIKANIYNNTLLSNHIGIMASIHAFTNISGNHVDTFDIGAAPQSGYDLYYGGIAISQYSRNSKRYGIVIDNNTITGDGKGISVGCDYVTISNNKFSSERCIYTELSGFNAIKIIGNTFNRTLVRHNFTDFVFLYNVKSAEISSNTFYSENYVQNTISGDNIVISKNELINTGLKNSTGGNNITVRDNLFSGNNFTDDILFINQGNNSVVDNNKFTVTNFNTADKYIIRFYGSSTNCTLSNNKVSATSNLETPTLIRFETINNCRIINNKYLDDSVVEFIRTYMINSSVLENNYTYSPLAGVIYHTGTCNGCNIVSANHGLIHGSGYQPNNSLNQMVNYYFQLSQRIYKYNINSSVTSLGWVCTSEGYYVTNVWTTDTSYNANTMIKNSLGNVYKVITKGSGNSSVEPTHTTNTDVTESDGYKWKYLGSVATFKDLTL